MRRSRFSRILAIALVTLVGLTSPGLAIAHGYAHHEASEHSERDGSHVAALGAATTDGSHADDSPLMVAAKEASSHGHPLAVNALPLRVDVPLFSFGTVPVAVPIAIVRVRSAAVLPSLALPRAGPASASPRQPRAPPLG